MLHRYGEVFRTLAMAVDLAIVGVAWLAAYWIRFDAFPAPLGIPEFRAYVEALVAILPLWHVLFRARGLYESCGFVVYGHQRDALRTGGRSYDELHLALRLGAGERGPRDPS